MFNISNIQTEMEEKGSVSIRTVIGMKWFFLVVYMHHFRYAMKSKEIEKRKKDKIERQ